jgi:hypothetical protein
MATSSFALSKSPTIVMPQQLSQDSTVSAMEISSTVSTPTDTHVESTNLDVLQQLNINSNSYVYFPSTVCKSDFTSAEPDHLARPPSQSLPAAVIPTSTSQTNLKGKRLKAVMTVMGAITAR